MKIVFWNTNRNKDHTPVVKLVDNTGVDLLFLAECSEDAFWELKKSYEEVIAPASKSKIKCFKINQAISCYCVREISPSLILYQAEYHTIQCTLGVLHLRSKLYADPHFQNGLAYDCIAGIKNYEDENDNMDTVLIGDFNMNPFDPGMVVSRGFNSVCSQKIAQKNDRTVADKVCHYFYNPSWKSFSGMGDEIYGSYYYHSCSGGHDFHWNNFDQVLLRPSVIQKYDHVFRILHDVAGFDLTKKNNGISDHYPIFLELQEKTNVEFT